MSAGLLTETVAVAVLFSGAGSYVGVGLAVGAGWRGEPVGSASFFKRSIHGSAEASVRFR